MKQCIVTIPIYKEIPNEQEIKSFRQVLRVLYKYRIIIFTYQSLDLSIYTQISKEENKDFNIIYFNKTYFTDGTNGYNKLLLSKHFYEQFTNYKYILIYQLDAWIFRDELEYWCDKNYDYIGAPWFKRDNKDYFTKNYDGVGNGGFSLRKISYCLQLLNYPPNKPFIKIKNLIKEINNFITFIKVILKIFGFKNNISFYINKSKLNEDYIFSQLASLSNINVNIPNESIALRFAFEVNPSYLYTQNGNKLPFGCHAFEKYEYELFWKDKIQNNQRSF